MPLPSLGAVKDHLNIPQADTTHDAELVGTFLPAAVRAIEGYINSPLSPTTVVETHPASSTLIPRLSRVVSLTSLTNATGMAVRGFAVEGSLIRTYDAVSTYGRVTLTYVAGFDPLPPDLYLAVLMQAEHLWRSQRGQGPSALPAEDDSGGAPAIAGGYMMPRAVQQLLGPYTSGARVA